MGEPKEPTTKEEEEYREWARENYEALADTNDAWHPVVRDECRKINDEYIKKTLEESRAFTSRIAEERGRPAGSLARLLARLHLWWLFLIPLAACFLAGMTKQGNARSMCCVGFALIVYFLFINKYYLLTGDSFRALISILVIPAEVVVLTLWLGEDIKFFIFTEASVEVAGLMIAITIVMFRHLPKPGGLGGAVLIGVVCALPTWFAFMKPAIASLPPDSDWNGLYFIAILFPVVWMWVKLIGPAAKGGRLPDGVNVSRAGWLGLLLPRHSKIRPISPSQVLRVNFEGMAFILLMLIWPILLYLCGLMVAR